MDELRGLDPSVQVREDDRWVDDATWSLLPVYPRESTWRCTWSPASPVLTVPGRCAAASSTTPTRPSEPEILVRFLDASTYTADRPWGALDPADIDGVTVRLHWTDQPYVWHVNDGPEICVVLDGAVDMHYRHEEGVWRGSTHRRCRRRRWRTTTPVDPRRLQGRSRRRRPTGEAALRAASSDACARAMAFQASGR